MPDDMEDHGAEVSDVVSENEDESETFHKYDDKMAENTTDSTTGEVKKKYDPKDPSRPRRKKARRACFACQRAHLTCGDERPCQRCVKRGLADACQDGVRKKAKYLHDAPPEALGPVLGPTYNAGTDIPARAVPRRQNSGHSDQGLPTTPGSNFFSQGTPSFTSYQGGTTQPPVGINENIPFTAAASQAPPSFQGGQGANGQAGINSMLSPNNMDFGALFDPSNPALYNFDLEGLNFGSQYTGWEFGILNKMGLGADTPPRESSISQTPTSEANYTAMFGNGSSNVLSGDYSGVEPTQGPYNQSSLQHGLPHAFAIAAGPTSLASPSTDATASPQTHNMVDGTPNPNNLSGVQMVATPRVKSKHVKAGQSILGKRQRDAASIYESVKEPYPYTAGFHKMIAVMRKRLPLNKLMRIARDLGEIRPSFIASTKDLTREDLVFMEKCFQRTLVEFDDFLQHCCAPTIVCRRSGEVAAVNKEFTALTGWTKDVLLGKEPNKHVNLTPSNGSAQEGDGARAETSTPQFGNASLADDSGRPQPVFIAELLDDDSIVEFYKDYSQLAFEDSRGKVQRSGRLVKYRTQDMLNEKTVAPQKDPRTEMLSNRVTRIDGEHGISRIEQDGKVSCTYCWTIKRDVFDIPMMIIINFLPRYQTEQEPHQLAV